MSMFFLMIYVLGCCVFGPIWGNAAQSRRGVNGAMLATILWPLVMTLGGIQYAMGNHR